MSDEDVTFDPRRAVRGDFEAGSPIPWPYRLSHYRHTIDGNTVYSRRWWWKAFGYALIGRPALSLSWRLHLWRFRDHYGSRWRKGI